MHCVCVVFAKKYRNLPKITTITTTIGGILFVNALTVGAILFFFTFRILNAGMSKILHVNFNGKMVHGLKNMDTNEFDPPPRSTAF